MSGYLMLLLGTALVNNVVLVKFLGLCPTMGVSKKIDSALGMGMATTFGMPADASDLAVMLADQYGPDGHSHSYDSLRKFLKIAVATKTHVTRWVGHEVISRTKRPDEALADLCKGFIGHEIYLSEADSLENYRVVFWFDN